MGLRFLNECWGWVEKKNFFEGWLTKKFGPENVSPINNDRSLRNDDDETDQWILYFFLHRNFIFAFCCQEQNYFSHAHVLHCFLDMACARVTDQVIPTLLEQFELHKQV